MAKKPKSWYAWHDATGKGGIFRTWSECETASKGRPGEKHKGFDSKEEAWNFAYPDKPLAPGVSEPVQTKQPVSSAFTNGGGSSDTHQADPAFRQIDPSRICCVEPSEEVNRFCAAYGFERLSRDQRRAVQTVDGKALLFAVPGSGKTTVLIARNGYMIHQRGIPPEKIVSLTFTKASAAEMRNRYQTHFTNDTVLPEFRTIHSFAFSIVIPLLRKAGCSIPLHLISDKTGDSGKKRRYEAIIFSEINDELRSVARELKEKKTVLLNGRKDREALKTAITGIKNTQMPREQLHEKTIRLHGGQDLPIDRAYDVYIGLCRKYNCMDYDDMLSYALDGLKKHTEVLSQLQERYRYWSIDESQDNSPLQYELLRLLVGDQGNLFMVGDDDQSIYAFRGAMPRLFQQFGMEPGVTVLTMGTNYRSVAGIVKTAETFIRYNPSHRDKQMQATHTEPGCIRFIYDLHSEKHQYEKIVETARVCIGQSRELAVLYRDNISALPIMFWLEKHGIPFFTAVRITELLQCSYVSRILNLLRFAVNPNSYSLCRKVRTDLHIQPSDDVISQWAKACKRFPDRNVLEVLAGIDGRNYAPTLELLGKVAAATAYEAIEKLIRSLDMNPNSQSERMQVNAILSTGVLYNNIREMLSAIDAMKRKLKDDGEDDGEDGDGEEAPPASEFESRNDTGHAVTLTTMHSAKGLEFDHVMIVDFLAPPDIPPKPAQLTFEDPEEPRRLFYVAVTRAKQTLDILTVQSYHGFIEKPHPFICLFASICDHEETLTEHEASVPDAAECVMIKAYGKYYGVPAGRVPGVYTSWEEAKTQTDHFPLKPNEQPKGFPTWEKAAAYAYPSGIPECVRPINTSFFRQYLVTNPTLRANWPRDIPLCITKGILELLHTDSLLSLDHAMLSRLKIDYLSSHEDAFDYSEMRALAYTVSYLPLNYYKCWTPLWKMLEQKKLPFQAKVLELGAGPGTSGIALLDFYGKLAAFNPGIRFAVDYTAVEREKDFQPIFDHLMGSMVSDLPENLHVSTGLIHADALDFMEKNNGPAYDIVLESNVLNHDEHITAESLSALSENFAHVLNENGHVILIEPGKKDQIPILEKAVGNEHFKPAAGPEITSVDTSSITLVNQCLKTGIRRKKITEHWYSVIVAERKSL